MKLSTSRFATRHDGFTLIEVLIALAIGMALTLVISLLFINTRQTYATTDDVSRMQENMRYTYQLLSRVVHLAGYKTSPNAKTDDIFNGANPVLGGTDGGGSVSDRFTVRYQGSSDGTSGVADGTVVDCLGRAVLGGVTAANEFTIAAGANDATALFCSVNGETPVEVVPNVANMQILYGVDTNEDLVADSYVALSGAALDTVRSIRFAFLFISPTQSAPLINATRTYDLNGVSVGPFPNDRYLRRVVTMTVSMRNRTP